MKNTDKPGAPEVPVGERANIAQFGSDVVAETLRDLGIEYIALNPGASFRGLHDSLVNFLGNMNPSMLLCLHEEHAVAIAQGYAKVTGRAMAAAVHSNVGLMHATMAVFNAWCDRMPVILLGATGPVDAEQRRPWIDWIHTARDQGALLRHYTKWDDQPASPGAAREALTRAAWIAENRPQGPVYINLDSGMQEMKLEAATGSFDVARHKPPVGAEAGYSDLVRLTDLVAAAERPLILQGRASREIDAWNARVALAEAIGARVITDIKLGAAFPTGHPLHAVTIGTPPHPALRTHISEADLIISLDAVDLAGTLSAGSVGTDARIVQISLDHHIHNGWSMDHQALPPVDLFISADPDEIATPLAELLEKNGIAPRPCWSPEVEAVGSAGAPAPAGKLDLEGLAIHLREAVNGREVSLLHVPIPWQGHWWDFTHPLDYVGSDSGGGIGGGPGIAVGAALALKNSGRLPLAVCGDGDFVMGATAIWTAVRYRIPLMIVVANNSSFFNDEIHQERVAIARGRPVENRWIGQKMIDPEIDLAAMATAQGATGFGPVTRMEELDGIFRQAMAVVDNGGVAVVDVRIEPGYPDPTSRARRRPSGNSARGRTV